jgi:hypothetical protein
MKSKPSFVLSELLIALIIFTSGLALGAYFFSQKPPLLNNPVQSGDRSKAPPLIGEHAKSDLTQETPIQVLDFKGIPSSAQMIKAFADQNKRAKRNPMPWDASVRSILNNSITSSQKIQALFRLADTLSAPGKHSCYTAIALTGNEADYQGLILPKIWDNQTPQDLSYTLASGLINQPDRLKLPAALELMQHPNDEVAYLAYSVLWAYFPDEPEENYPSAVGRFLSKSANNK